MSTPIPKSWSPSFVCYFLPAKFQKVLNEHKLPTQISQSAEYLLGDGHS